MESSRQLLLNYIEMIDGLKQEAREAQVIVLLRHSSLRVPHTQITLLSTTQN